LISPWIPSVVKHIEGEAVSISSRSRHREISLALGFRMMQGKVVVGSGTPTAIHAAAKHVFG
jgi:hypothetical protein